MAAIRLLIQQWNGVWVIVLRDIKQEFAHTILGPIWFIIQPLIQSVVFYFVFGEVGRMPTEGKSSFFFYIFGILIWTSFSQISLNNSWTMIHNRGVITKIKTSPFLFPVANLTFRMLQCFTNISVFTIVFFISVGIELDYGLHTVASIIFGIFVCGATGMFTGLFASSFSSVRRDLIHLWGYVLNALMYLSPIIYPVRELSGTWYFLASFNPLTIGIESVRGAIIVDKFLPWHFYVNGLLMLGVLMLFSSFFYILNFYKGLDRI